MKTINISELVAGARGFRRASELVEDLKGRPESFPAILIVKRISESDSNYQVLKIEEAIYNGLKVEVLFDTGEVIEVDDDHRFQLWREPIDYRSSGQ